MPIEEEEVTIYKMKTTLFWVITQRVVAIVFTDVSGKPIGPEFKGPFRILDP